MNPEFADETPVNPFDLWEGANFKVKIRQVEGYRNYDKSEFSAKSAVYDGDDEKLEKLWKSEYSLKEFTEASNFKSYDVLKQRLDKVLGFDGAVNMRTRAEQTSVDTYSEEATSVLDNPRTSSVSTDDDDLNYFKSLANQN